MAKLVLLFTIVPLVELYLLLLLGDYLGFWPTVGVVLATGLAGAWLSKREGLRVLHQWRKSLGQGRMPEEGVLGGVLLLVGAVLLVTPGVMTDVVGLALLVPPSRAWVARWLRPRIQRRIEGGLDSGSISVVNIASGLAGDPGRRNGDPEIIDVEGSEVPREP